jgi:(2R)-ethylmalonyl-CoA mutase
VGLLVGGLLVAAGPAGAAAAARSPTPRDFGLTAIVGRIVDEIRLAHQLRPLTGPPTIEPEGELI